MSFSVRTLHSALWPASGSWISTLGESPDSPEALDAPVVAGQRDDEVIDPYQAAADLLAARCRDGDGDGLSLRARGRRPATASADGTARHPHRLQHSWIGNSRREPLQITSGRVTGPAFRCEVRLAGRRVAGQDVRRWCR